MSSLTKERGEVYGHPRVNHARTARLWSVFLENRGGGPLGLRLTPEDVCMMNILQKIARAQHGVQDVDTVEDIAGYANNILEIWND